MPGRFTGNRLFLNRGFGFMGIETFLQSSVSISLITPAPYCAWSPLNLSSAPSGTQRFWARPGKRQSHQQTFSWLPKSPPHCSWDGSGSTGTGLHCSYAPEQRPTRTALRGLVCGCCFLFPSRRSSCLPPSNLPPCEWLKLSWTGSITSSVCVRSQLFLEERQWISLRCQSFHKIMLDLISFILLCMYNELLLCSELGL